MAETFAREMEKSRWPLRAVRNLLPHERTDIPFDGEKFLVAKRPDDEPIVTSLFEVDLRGAEPQGREVTGDSNHSQFFNGRPS